MDYEFLIAVSFHRNFKCNWEILDTSCIWILVHGYRGKTEVELKFTHCVVQSYVNRKFELLCTCSINLFSFTEAFCFSFYG